MSENSVESPFKQYLTNAMRYWELRRLLYNAVLAIVVAIHYFAYKATVPADTVLFMFLLAVMANIAYCTAYLPDLFFQSSGLREQWLRLRWIVFTAGMGFAAVITRFFCVALFADR